MNHTCSMISLYGLIEDSKAPEKFFFAVQFCSWSYDCKSINPRMDIIYGFLNGKIRVRSHHVTRGLQFFVQVHLILLSSLSLAFASPMSLSFHIKSASILVSMFRGEMSSISRRSGLDIITHYYRSRPMRRVPCVGSTAPSALSLRIGYNTAMIGKAKDPVGYPDRH